MTRPDFLERRRSTRSHIPGATAVVLARTHSAIFAVEDVSTSGALLLGQLPLACGELVTVMFDLDRVPITVSAVVMRLEIRNGARDAVALAFRDVSPATQHFIQRLVLKTLQRSQQPPRTEDAT